MTQVHRDARGPTSRTRRRCGYAVPVSLAAVLLCASTAAAQDAPAAPLVNPGAPGTASRTLTPEESIDLGQARYTADDVAFMQHMIVHHGQAVDMGDLIEARTTHEGVRLMGERISISQTAEIAMMKTWLTRRGESTDMPGHGAHMGGMDHSGHGDMSEPSDVPVMAGMLSPKQMAELAASEGAEFDRLYLTGMIHHHQGAIDMVYALLAKPGAGEDPELSQFLTDIIADQSAEILRMRSMLAALS